MYLVQLRTLVIHSPHSIRCVHNLTIIIRTNSTWLIQSEAVLSREAIAYWTSFVATGDPSQNKLATSSAWNKFTNQTDASGPQLRMRLDRGNNLVTGSRMEPISAAQMERCQFWMSDAVVAQTGVWVSFSARMRVQWPDKTISACLFSCINNALNVQLYYGEEDDYYCCFALIFHSRPHKCFDSNMPRFNLAFKWHRLAKRNIPVTFYIGWTSLSTHYVTAERNSRVGSISLPLSSMALEILKAARMEAALIQKVKSAMCAPGQILFSKFDERVNHHHHQSQSLPYRRPNPKATVAGSRTDGFKLPSAWRKRSGWNAFGSGYELESWSIALEWS